MLSLKKIVSMIIIKNSWERNKTDIIMTIVDLRRKATWKKDKILSVVSNFWSSWHQGIKYFRKKHRTPDTYESRQANRCGIIATFQWVFVVRHTDNDLYFPLFKSEFLFGCFKEQLFWNPLTGKLENYLLRPGYL